MKRNYSSKSKKMRRMSSVPSEKSFSFHEQGAPLSIYVGMIGNGKSGRKRWSVNIHGLPKGSCTLIRIICNYLLALENNQMSLKSKLFTMSPI